MQLRSCSQRPLAAGAARNCGIPLLGRLPRPSCSAAAAHGWRVLLPAARPGGGPQQQRSSAPGPPGASRGHGQAGDDAAQAAGQQPLQEQPPRPPLLLQQPTPPLPPLQQQQPGGVGALMMRMLGSLMLLCIAAAVGARPSYAATLQQPGSRCDRTAGQARPTLDVWQAAQHPCHWPENGAHIHTRTHRFASACVCRASPQAWRQCHAAAAKQQQQ